MVRVVVVVVSVDGDSVVGAGVEDGCVCDVKGVVVTGEVWVAVRVTDVVVGRVGEISVMTEFVDTSRVGASVVFQVDVVLVGVTAVSTRPVVAAVEEGVPMVVDVMSVEVGVDATWDSVVECRVCVLITDEVVLSVPVVLGLLVDVEEGPEEVPGMLVGTEGVGVLW